MTAGLENRPLTRRRDGGHGAPAGRSAGAAAPGVSPPASSPRPATSPMPHEIHALARVLRRHGAAYSTHVRDEANAGFEAVREAIAVAEATGVHVQIAHLKLSGFDNWGGAAKLLGEIAAARAARAAGRLRRLSLRHRDESAAESAAPLGDGERHPGDARAAAGPRRAHAAARRDRAARPHQLRADPVVGRRACGHLAPPAGERRPHAGRHRAQPRRRSDRRRRRLHRGRSGRDAHPHHVDGGR